MSSRSPSPPYRGRRCGEAGQPSMGRLPRRPRRLPRSYSPARRAASMSSPPSPVLVSRDWHSLSPPPPDASVVDRGLHAPPQPQHQEGSESGSELDSPPRIRFLTEEENPEPPSPTSPPGSPPSVDVKVDANPAGSPKDSSNDEEDPYFMSLVDNFINATADMCNSTLSDDDIDCKAEDQRRSVLYAESALKHYNNHEKNKIKYELISGITSCDMMDEKGCFSHVNFTAKGNQQHSEELFFAEIRRDGDNLVPICVVSLDGIKKVGGLCDTRYDNKFYSEPGLPIDARHCYACDRGLKHPKNGELYVMGHVAVSDYYHG